MREFALLTLTDLDDYEFYLDVDAIESFGHREEDERTGIQTRSGTRYWVKETPDEIIGLINEMYELVG